jgi:hypothetical protein
MQHTIRALLVAAACFTTIVIIKGAYVPQIIITNKQRISIAPHLEQYQQPAIEITATEFDVPATAANHSVHQPSDFTGKSCTASHAPFEAYDIINISSPVRGDFFSQTDGKRIAEIYYGDSDAVMRPSDAIYHEWKDEYADCIQHGTIIWVDSDSVESFIAKKLPLIPPDRRIVMVTGDSDRGVVKDQSLGVMLNDQRVLHVCAKLRSIRS